MRRATPILALLAMLSVHGCSDSDSGPTAPAGPTAAEPALAAQTPGDDDPLAGARKGGGQPKVGICHLDDSGTYVILSIAEPAVRGHRGHGDGFPGEEVPGGAAKFLGDCQPVPVGPGHDVLGANGGTVESADGNAALQIPAAALSEWTLVGIESGLTSASQQPGFVSGTDYDLGPDGTRFGAPVEVRIRYAESASLQGFNLTAGQVENLIRFEHWVAGTPSAAATGSVDAASNTVIGQLSSFSGASISALRSASGNVNQTGLLCERELVAVRDGEQGASLSLTCSDWDSDDDGVRNADDACPLVPGNGPDGCAAAACFWNDEFEAHPICYNAVCDRYLTGRWLAHLGTWLLTALKNPSEGVDNSIEAFIESWSVHNEGGDWQVSRRIDTPISVGTFPPETVRYSPAGSDPSTASEVEFTIGTNIHATLRRCNQ